MSYPNYALNGKEAEKEYSRDKDDGYQGETTAKLMDRWLCESLDTRLFTEYHRQRCQLLGVDASNFGPVYGPGGRENGDWPMFPLIKLEEVKVGSARRMMDGLFIHVGRSRSADVAPEITLISKMKAEGLAEWGKDRLNGGYGKSSWDLTQATIDLIEFGIGYIQPCVELARSGYQRGCVKHHDLCHVLRDRFNRNPTKGRRVAFLNPLTPEDCAGMFGSRSFSDADIRYMRDGATQSRMAAVPVVEYYDAGWQRGDQPKWGVKVGGIKGRTIAFEDSPCDHMDNPIPLAVGYSLTAPGTLDPMGGVMRQMALSAALDKLDDQMEKDAHRPHLLIADTTQLSERDVKKLKADFGRRHNIWVLEKKLPEGTPFVFIEVPGLTQETMKRQADLERLFSKAEGLTEYDHGMLPDDKRLATEVRELVGRSDENQSGKRKEVADLLLMSVEKGFEYWKRWDRDPFIADVSGYHVRINDPSDARTMVSEWMKEKFNIRIGTDSVTPSDDRRKVRELIQQWAEITSVAPGAFDQWAVAKELMNRAHLVDDPEDFKSQGAPVAPQV